MKKPSPNAYDFFTAAGGKLVNPAATDIAASAASTQSLDQKRILVRQNAAALAKLREGLRYDYCPPFKYGINAQYPEYRTYRQLGSLLKLDAEMKAADKDWAGCISSCQDGLMLGELIQRHDPTSMSRVLGTRCHKDVRPAAWTAIPRLSSAEGKRAIERMGRIETRHFPFQDSLRLEEAAELRWLIETFDGRYKSDDTKEFHRLPDYIKADVLNRYAAYMDESIRLVGKPYASKPRFPEIKQSSNPMARLRYGVADVILEITCWPVGRRWLTELDCEARDRMLKLALALQAYRCDHGKYPGDLQDLIPAYLQKIPADPFALKGPFRYQPRHDKYVLWSVGPDGVDDNGRPVTDRSQKTTGDRYRIQEDSTGDIVAAVHL